MYHSFIHTFTFPYRVLRHLQPFRVVARARFLSNAVWWRIVLPWLVVEVVVMTSEELKLCSLVELSSASRLSEEEKEGGGGVKVVVVSVELLLVLLT